ncbi:MAG: EAL domain-containing protein [Treponema sp.]|nr:EAL domain-containing protein [Treponema sp.]
MSTRKERKIRRLRKQSLWPQIIEVFIVEAAIVFIVAFVLIIDLKSDQQKLVSSSPKTCSRIVNEVSRGWDSSQNKLADNNKEQIQNIVKYNNEHIGGVCLIDNNQNILESYGDPLDDTFLHGFSKNNFDENGVFFMERFIDSEREEDITYLEKDFDDDLIHVTPPFYNLLDSDEDDESLKNFFRLFFSSGNDARLTHKKMFKWATTSIGANTMWILYKTDVPQVNVAIKKKVGQTQIDSSRHLFMILIFLLCFAFIAVYENYKIIVAIVNIRRIQKIIYTDSMTGGNNKEYFLKKAARMIRKRNDKKVMVYLRMEKYRHYLTAYGIKEGENLMEDFYKLLLQMTKKRKELIAHLEKSDFVLLLHFDNEDLLNIRMQAITRALNDCRPDQHLFFTVGACRINSRSDSILEKITNAGSAISRQENKNESVLWYDESLREEQIWERRVEDDMDKALENNEFKVYLQPKYSTKKEQLSAAEALVRWIHPEYGFVSPGKFIPIFEKNGFIVKLDDFMLSEVSKLQAAWLEQGKKLVPISVNVSRAHFSREDLAEHICSIVDEYKVPHEYIELELTESAFFDDKQILLSTVKKLKEYGFKVSMDDFGAGYSSLNSLKELPLDIIKLDAQFFRDIEDKKRADLIVCDTIKLAKKLGMQIVAEGIETREQVDFLADQHCDLIQGFYFAKPLPIEEFEERAFSQGK